MDSCRTKSEAVAKGRALLARMKGKGWKLRVHENLGWHYCVYSGPVGVSPSRTSQGVRFFSLVAGEPEGSKGSSGLAVWSPNGTDYKDPNRAAQEAVKIVREVVGRYNQVLANAERAIGRT